MLSLVIPAHNEERRIIPVIRSFLRYFSGIEVIVVDNGSTDATDLMVRRMRDSRVRLLSFPEKLGKGGAILRGFRAAQGDIIGFSDADQAVAPADFQRLIKHTRHADAAIGSRRVAGSTIMVRQPSSRRFFSRGFNILVNLLFHLHIHDTQCGAKVFRREALLHALPLVHTTGFAFDVELLWRLKQKGYSVVEVPVAWRHEPGGSFRLTAMPEMLIALLKIRFS
ncbi:glycosyltransferase family 2 protein [Candidatus Woesearchaeota archaeon]|nr:glycosyltransferase family 2 protein [Candidatus Woesearchaeota archaeon]